jgi:hypothetical protein
MASFRDPRSCLRDFLQTGRNLGKRPPSFSLRNVQRDIRAVKTRIDNIGDRVEGAIGALGRGEFLPGQLLSITNEFRCPPSAYANFFSQHQQPKFKFMFFAGLTLNSDFVDAFGGKNFSGGEIFWFIKQSGRPNVTYEYEEANMYNFRQKVLRRATLEPIQIQMYDDLKDASHGFWNTFIRIQNPVTNIFSAGGKLVEQNGMSWDIEESLTNLDVIRSVDHEQPGTTSSAINNSAGTAVLPGSNQEKQIIQSIQLYHLVDWGRKIIVYNFVNPRINEIRLDELSWDSSDPNIIDVTFEYDAFNIFFPRGFSEDEINKWQPGAYPININSDETPFGALNKGIKSFNNVVGKGIDTAKKIGGGLF